MTRPAVSRLVLVAYPKSFRRAYGDEVARSVDDLRRHDHVRGLRLWARLAGDVARTAPRMRLESLMSRSHAKPIAIAGLLVIAVMAAAIGSPVFLLLIAAVAGLLFLLTRSAGRPIATDAGLTHHWYRWLVAGAASFAAGFGILVVDGPELSEIGWTVWMLTFAGGVVLVLFGLVLGGSRLLARTRTT